MCLVEDLLSQKFTLDPNLEGNFLDQCQCPFRVCRAPMAERSEAYCCPLADDCSSLCPEKLGSNPGQGSEGINFSGWHGLDMSVTVTKRR